jgi:hypothetical protein
MEESKKELLDLVEVVFTRSKSYKTKVLEEYRKAYVNEETRDDTREHVLSIMWSSVIGKTEEEKHIVKKLADLHYSCMITLRDECVEKADDRSVETDSDMYDTNDEIKHSIEETLVKEGVDIYDDLTDDLIYEYELEGSIPNDYISVERLVEFLVIKKNLKDAKDEYQKLKNDIIGKIVMIKPVPYTDIDERIISVDGRVTNIVEDYVEFLSLRSLAVEHIQEVDDLFEKWVDIISITIPETYDHRKLINTYKEVKSLEARLNDKVSELEIDNDDV